MNVPLRHHYSPEFYLSRWRGDDGRICQFAKLPDGRVVPNRRYTKQTGFQDRLYEVEGLPPEDAQHIEANFMRRVDTLAADALRALETGDPRINRDSHLRSAWSRFILSLMLRDPESIQALKEGISLDWSLSMVELEPQYQAIRKPEDPQTLAGFMQQYESSTDGWAMETAPRLIDHSLLGGLLNNMRWFIREITSENGEFVTSDRPVFSTWTLTEPNAFLFLPIGPKKVFVAVNDVRTQSLVLSRDPADFVNSLNEMMFGRAVKFAYARDDSLLPVANALMGKRQRPTLFEQLAAMRKKRTERTSVG